MPARSERRKGERVLALVASENVARMRRSRESWYSNVASSFGAAEPR
jgi:hypothetical protein